MPPSAPPGALRVAPGVDLRTARVEATGGSVRIGAGCVVGPHATFVAHDGDVEVRDGAVVGERAVVVGPCVVGERAVVAPGAVVVADVPAGASAEGRDGRPGIREELATLRALVERTTGEGGVPTSEPGTVRETALATDRRTTYAALAEVARAHRAPPATAEERAALRRLPLTGWERGVTSQWGEDGVIAEILRRIGPGDPSFVEFGVQSGREANCALLALLGWPGVMLEADKEDARWLARRYAGAPGVRTAQAFVWPETVEALFAEHGVPEEPSVLSIDIDSVDWWVWRAVRSYRPRLVVIEYNAAAPSGCTVPADARGGWDGTSWFGASLEAHERLARAKGYRLVHTELNGANAFFVRTDLDQGLPEAGVVPRRAPNYGLRDGFHLPDPHGRPWVAVGEDGEPA